MTSKYLIGFLILILLSCRTEVTNNNNHNTPSSSNGNEPSQPSRNSEEAEAFDNNDDAKILFETKKEGTKSSTLTRFTKDGKALKRREFLELLGKNNQSGESLRLALSASLASLPLNLEEIEFESPVINEETANEDYFYRARKSSFTNPKAVSTYKNYTFHCETSLDNSSKESTDYKNKYRFIQGYKNNTLMKAIKTPSGSREFAAISFASTVKKERATYLVSPCPYHEKADHVNNEPLVHLRKYMTKIMEEKNKEGYPLNPKRIHSLWKLVSKESLTMIKERGQVYLNTHGHGQNYLHVRCESAPAYDPYKNDVPTKETYKAVFN